MFLVNNAGGVRARQLGISVARWYRPGYQCTPQEIGELNARAALRIVGRNQ